LFGGGRIAFRHILGQWGVRLDTGRIMVAVDSVVERTTAVRSVVGIRGHRFGRLFGQLVWIVRHNTWFQNEFGREAK
jgi:hypothetical protein